MQLNGCTYCIYRCFVTLNNLPMLMAMWLSISASSINASSESTYDSIYFGPFFLGSNTQCLCHKLIPQKSCFISRKVYWYYGQLCWLFILNMLRLTNNVILVILYLVGFRSFVCENLNCSSLIKEQYYIELYGFVFLSSISLLLPDGKEKQCRI